ncbi:MAG TPA: tRNA (adenosine(37)-N6)-threonylcarbamoyltransferase complex dimerization subunit type 1 TsaB [Blastocatellia bacterium]|nr:tRNA (adenosine(37)-N6)-threonylcarbamoyltransferase complex dimerization subunit type 1 TsaB [Blastocatellia bacterium]
MTGASENETSADQLNDSGPLVLAVDTSSPQAGLALARGVRLLAVITDQSGRPHSQTLFQNLNQLLGEAGLRPDEVDAFAVVTGPGSFTGLRVGMAAVKGLAHTLGRPALGVTTIDAWALAAGVSGRVLVMIDAMRGEVFCGLREVNSNGKQPSIQSAGRDLSASPEAALAQMKSLIADGEVTVIGTGTDRYHEMIARELPHAAVLTGHPALAPHVAKYAATLLEAGSLPEVKACYLRPSDAEIKFPALLQPHA